jgi:hypothetical protein
LFLHGLALLAAFLNPLPIAMRLAVSAVVMLSLWLNLRRWRHPLIAGLSQRPDGGWRLYSAKGAEFEASLLGSSLANPWFVLLHLRTESARLNLLLCRDSLPEDGFRRLRVALQASAGLGAKRLLNP